MERLLAQQWLSNAPDCIAQKWSLLEERFWPDTDARDSRSTAHFNHIANVRRSGFTVRNAVLADAQAS
jgi:hypothetical protein